MFSDKFSDYTIKVKAIQYTKENAKYIFRFLEDNKCHTNLLDKFVIFYKSNKMARGGYIPMGSWLVYIDDTIIILSDEEFSKRSSDILTASKTTAEFVKEHINTPNKPSCDSCSNRLKTVCNSCHMYDTYEPIWKNI